MAITIANSVGQGGTNNPNDVLAVKTRLVELGFNFITANTEIEPLTIRAIKLFQAIKSGLTRLDKPGVDGRVDVGGETLKWLQAVNAPQWIRMPAGSAAEGFVNDNIADLADRHDFGTHWLSDTLRATAARYKADHLSAHPGAAILHINDTSLPQGGDTSAHAEHEAGLQSDIRLPRRDGGVGGTTVFDLGVYDRDAMRAMIKAFRQQPLATQVFLNDTALIAEGLSHHASGHENHAHFGIKPPQRQMPQ
jgi:hypothetical protein